METQSRDVAAFAVFSGGGAQGIALAGAYQAAQEAGFVFKGYGGTSAGAIIAVLAAAGLSGEQMLQQSIRGKPGHPSRLFSDPPRKHKGARFPGQQLRLDHALSELDRAIGTRKPPNRPRGLDPKSASVAEDDLDVSDSHAARIEPGAKLPTASNQAWSVLVRLFLLFLLIGFLALTAFGATITLAPLTLLESPWQPLLLWCSGVISIALALWVLSGILRRRLGLLRVPFLSMIRLGHRGRYWLQTIDAVRKDFGLLDGEGLENALNEILERPLMEANGRQSGGATGTLSGSIAPGKFSDLTFRQFEELFGTSLKIVASDLWSGKPIIFESDAYPDHRVMEAIRASTAFPLAFKPVIYRTPPPAKDQQLGLLGPTEIQEHVLVDGGVSSNTPAFLFKRESDFTKHPTVAFQLNYSYPGPTYPDTMRAYLASLTRTAVGAGDTIIQGLVPRMHVVAVSGLEEYGVLDGNLSSKAVRRLFALGYGKRDELGNIWKICQIEQSSFFGVQFEFGPVLDVVRQRLGQFANGRDKFVSCALWLPASHTGHLWACRFVSRPSGTRIPRDALIGQAAELPRLQRPDRYESFMEKQGRIETNDRMVANHVERARENRKFTQAEVIGCVHTRDLRYSNQGEFDVLAFPIFARTIDSESWRRGKDVIGILTAHLDNHDEAVTHGVQGFRSAQESATSWVRQNRESQLELNAELAEELRLWSYAISRMIAS